MRKTKDQLLDSTLRELGFSVSEEEISIGGNCIHQSTLGIELIEEKPEITIKNLGLFMAKFEGYPEAKFLSKTGNPNDAGHWRKDKLRGITSEGKYLAEYGICWHECEVIDERWTKENLGGE